MYNLAIRELNNLVIPDADPNKVSDDRVDYELSMQSLAGEEPSTDFQTVRDSLAIKQREADQQFDMDYVEAALRSNRITPDVATNILQYSYQLQPESSLERAAGEGVAATALAQNPDQAQIAYADGDGFIEDMSRKNTALLGLIQNLREYSTNAQGFLGDTMDFSRTLIDPGYHQLGVAAGYSKTLTGGEKLAKTSGGLAKTIRSRLEAMRLTMSAPEFEANMSKIYEEITSANPNTWILDDLIDAIEGGNNITDVVGATEVIGLGKGIAKAAHKGFNKAAMRIAAKEAIRTGTNVEKLSTALPTAVKPVEQTITTSAHSVGKYDISEEIIKMAQADMLVEGLEEGEKKALTDFLRKNVNQTWGVAKDEPVDIALDMYDDSSAIVTYKVGGANGQGMILEQALNRQKQLAAKGVECDVIRDDGTGAYLQFKTTVEGDRLHSFIENVNGSSEWTTQDGIFSGITNWLNKMVAGSTNLSEVAHAKDIQAARVHSALYNKYYASKKATYDSLDKYQKALIEQVHKEGVNKATWFDDARLHNFGLDDKGIEAYHAYKNMEDLTYVMDNYRTVRNLNREGNRFYSHKYVGKEVPSVSIDYSKSAIIDEAGQLMDKTKLISNAGDYTFIKLKEGVNSANATHLAIRKGAEIEADIPQFVLPYLAGGRRQYLKGTYFVRALGHVKDELGNKVAQRVRVLTTARTAEDAAKCVDEINSVIKVIKEVGDDALEGARKLKTLDLQHFRINDWDQVKEMVKAGILDPDGQAKYMTHGKKFIPDSTDIIENTDDFALDLLKTREIFNSHRGNLLDDVFGNDALTYSMDEMFNKAVARAASLGARGDLMDWYKKSLTTYINKGMFKNGDRLRQLDPEHLIKEAVLVDRKKIADVDLQDYRAAENMLLHARRICNAKTPGDTAIERFMSSVAEHIYPTASKLIKDPELVSRIMTKVESFNPSKFAQGLSFQAYMGFWNPAQLYKQMMGTANVMFMEPVRGVQAAISYPLVRLARATKDLPEVQKKYLAGIKKITGMDDDAVEGLFKYMDRHGTEFSSGLFIGAEDYSRALLRDSNAFKSKLWQSQYFFMREGNAANYYVADIAAYLAKHNKGHRAVAAYADDLFLNMTKASASELQTGVTSLFTQWLTYPMRAMEAMGNKRLSKSQRLGLLLGNLGMYGAGGTLGLNLYNSLAGEDITPEAALFIQNGIVGAIGKELGVNLDEGVSAYEVFKNVTGIYDITEGKFTLPPISAGAGIATWVNAINYFGKGCVTAATDLTLDDLAREIAEEKFLPSSLKNSAKALLGFRYNKLINSRGVVADDPTTTQKVFQALGFQPYEAKAIRAMQEAIMDQDKTVNEHVESIKPITQAVNRYFVNSLDTDEGFHRLVRQEDRMIAEMKQNLVEVFGEDSSAVIDFIKRVNSLKKERMKFLEDEALLKGSKKLNSARFEAFKYLMGEQ